jgi:hypothetical protein
VGHGIGNHLAGKMLWPGHHKNESEEQAAKQNCWQHDRANLA